MVAMREGDEAYRLITKAGEFVAWGFVSERKNPPGIFEWAGRYFVPTGKTAAFQASEKAKPVKVPVYIEASVASAAAISQNDTRSWDG